MRRAKGDHNRSNCPNRQSRRKIDMMIRHCQYCGQDLGYEDNTAYGPVTCGKQECDRWAHEEELAEREEAHESLDYVMGWYQ